MTDHFAAFGLPRRPWLDPDFLRDRLHERTAQLHPDLPGGDAERFSKVNTAYTVLRDPASRLRHLLELTCPEALRLHVPIPMEMADLFLQIATLCQHVEEFKKKHSAASTALLRAILAIEKARLKIEIERAVESLQPVETEALSELRLLDAQWPEALLAGPAEATPAVDPALDFPLREALAQQCQRWAFLAKWNAHPARKSAFSSELDFFSVECFDI